MSLLWLEGWEGFNGTSTAQTNADVLRKYPGSTMDNSGRPTGRFGGTGLQGGGVQLLFTQDFASPGATYIMGAAVRFGKWPTTVTGLPLFVLYDGSTRQVGVWLQKGGEITVKRGTTTLSTATKRVEKWRWYYLEFKATINNTTGSYSVRLDHVEIISATGQDTQATAAAQATKAAFAFACPGGIAEQQYLDDMYVCDTAGSVNNDFLGDQFVVGLFPDGDGDASDFTPDSGGTNSTQVDEARPDDDTTYVESATSTDQDLYTYDDMPSIPDSLNGVQINTVLKQDAAETLKTLIKTGTTVSADSAQAVDSNYEELVRIAEQDPDTAAAWTPSGVNGAQFGVEVG